MHILLSNDDGIFARGIHTLCEVLRAGGHRLSVCAPDRERSAASHSATLGKPLHAEPVRFEGAEQAWAADGTPADCASLGLWLTRDDPVDLVVAGINRGMNQGGATIYSGTVGAAMEASMCGFQAMAVSLCTTKKDDENDYTAAARLAMRVAEWMPGHPLPRGAIYNLNVPAIPYDAIRGLVPATLSQVFLDAPMYAQTRDAGGVSYYYQGVPSALDEAGSDFPLTERGFATITKLTWNWRLNADDAELAEIGL